MILDCRISRGSGSELHKEVLLQLSLASLQVFCPFL